MIFPDWMLPEEVTKSQFVRFLDVFVLGPFMIYAATHKGVMPGWMRGALMFGGVMTVLYNMGNYIETERLNYEKEIQLRQEV